MNFANFMSTRPNILFVPKIIYMDNILNQKFPFTYFKRYQFYRFYNTLGIL